MTPTLCTLKTWFLDLSFVVLLAAIFYKFWPLYRVFHNNTPLVHVRLSKWGMRASFFGIIFAECALLLLVTLLSPYDVKPFEQSCTRNHEPFINGISSALKSIAIFFLLYLAYASKDAYTYSAEEKWLTYCLLDVFLSAVIATILISVFPSSSSARFLACVVIMAAVCSVVSLVFVPKYLGAKNEMKGSGSVIIEADIGTDTVDGSGNGVVSRVTSADHCSAVREGSPSVVLNNTLRSMQEQMRKEVRVGEKLEADMRAHKEKMKTISNMLRRLELEHAWREHLHEPGVIAPVPRANGPGDVSSFSAIAAPDACTDTRADISGPRAVHLPRQQSGDYPGSVSASVADGQSREW